MKVTLTIEHLDPSTHGMFKITTFKSVILIFNNAHQVRPSVMRQRGPSSDESWFDTEPALLRALWFTVGSRGRMEFSDGGYLYGNSTWHTSEVQPIERIRFTGCYKCGRRTCGQRRPFCLHCTIDGIRFRLHMWRISRRPRKKWRD